MGWFLFRTEVMSLVVGLVVGAIGGAVIAWSRQRGWMSDTWAQLSTLVVALVCFQVGERLDGSGLVTALAGGLAFAFAAKRAGGRPDTHVSDADGQLLELGIFAMFGAYAPHRALPHLPRGLASGGWRLGSLRRRPGWKPARPGLGCR